MRLIDLDAFWNYVRSYKINFGKYQHDLLNKQPTVQAVPLSVLQEIRQKIESNMETITGTYDASTPEYNMPSHKIERNFGRKECIAIIDKHMKEIEGSDTE